jgi:acyl carrier protein
MSLQRDLAMDSLALVAFAVRLGEEFGIDLNQFADRIGDTRTVNDVIVTAKSIIEQSKAA